jgi:hypothetical protein
MRHALIARLLALAVLFTGGLLASAQAAPQAQEAGIDQAGLPARIAVVHAAPFASDTTVTVIANDILLLDDSFQFGEQTGYLSVPAGTYKIEVFVGTVTVAQSATLTPVIVENVTVAAGTDYTVVAVGTNTTAYPLDLLILDDAAATPASATAKLRVVHVAPFDPAGPSATGVDVVTDAGVPVGITNLRYFQTTDFLTLPSGVELNLKVVPTGQSGPTLIDLSPVTLNAGQVLTVFAVGGANGQTPSVLVQPFVQRAPALLRLVHAAPFATGNATVTVSLNGQVLTNSFNFGNVTRYQSLPAGIYTVRVFAGTTATGTPALETVLLLQDSARYTAVAMGTGSVPYPLQLRVLTDNNAAAPSATARLRVLHAAPFAPTVAGTAVDIVAQNGAVLPGLTNLTYDDLVDNYSVPSGTPLDLKVVPTGQPNATPVIDIPPVTFNAGDAYTVIAVGGANGQTAGVLLLNDRVVPTSLYLPMIAR